MSESNLEEWIASSTLNTTARERKKRQNALIPECIPRYNPDGTPRKTKDICADLNRLEEMRAAR